MISCDNPRCLGMIKIDYSSTSASSAVESTLTSVYESWLTSKHSADCEWSSNSSPLEITYDPNLTKSKTLVLEMVKQRMADLQSSGVDSKSVVSVSEIEVDEIVEDFESEAFDQLGMRVFGESENENENENEQSKSALLLAMMGWGVSSHKDEASIKITCECCGVSAKLGKNSSKKRKIDKFDPIKAHKIYCPVVGNMPDMPGWFRVVVTICDDDDNTKSGDVDVDVDASVEDGKRDKMRSSLKTAAKILELLGR